NSIKVTLADALGSVQSQVLARPTGGGQTSAAFDTLPLGNATLTAAAYPNTNGTGVAQAQAATLVAVAANTTTPVSLTLASTIDHLELLPASSSIKVGETVQLSVSAKDSAGSLV